MSIDIMKDNGFKLAKERSRRYPVQTIMDMDYTDDIALLANTPAQTETLLHSLEQVAAGIGLHVNADKTEYMCFNQRGNIFTLNGSSLKLVDKFTYLRNSVSSTRDKQKHQQLSIGYQSYGSQDLADEIKLIFFQAVVVLILLYGCTSSRRHRPLC